MDSGSFLSLSRLDQNNFVFWCGFYWDYHWSWLWNLLRDDEWKPLLVLDRHTLGKTALSWAQRILHLCFPSPLHIKALPRLPTLFLFPECARVIHLYFSECISWHILYVFVFRVRVFRCRHLQVSVYWRAHWRKCPWSVLSRSLTWPNSNRPPPHPSEC